MSASGAVSRWRLAVGVGTALILAAPLAVDGPAAAASTEQVRLSTSWSGSRFVVGERALVTGSVRPEASVARVVLQWRSPDGWRKVEAVRPDGDRYAIRVPTGWYGDFTYRVHAVGTDGTRSAVGDLHDIRVVPSYDPRGSRRDHELAADPVARWDACTPIGYRVNTRLASPGALKDVRGAFRRIHEATGLRFVHRGRTRIIPRDYVNDYPEGTDLVIAWARPSQTPLLDDREGGPLGVGGAAWTFGYHNADGSPASRITTGHVVIDANQQDRTPAGFGRGATRGELLMHEIGHAIGLQHVDDTRQLMYPLMQPGRARWGAGDLAGLAKVGAHQGCLS